MSNRPIAFFDSGLGGVPYYEWAARELPAERFVYLADTRHFPYGEKSPELVREIVIEQIGNLIQATDPKVVVIACNTASVIALDALRAHFTVPILGTVPAIKPAALITRNRKIAVFATERTVKDQYTEQLVRDFAADCVVERVAASQLVGFVERRLFAASPDERSEVVARAVEPLKAAGVDTVVLGCTHFVYLADDISRALGENVRVLDSREGVGRQLIRTLQTRGLVNSADPASRAAQADRSRCCFYVSGFDVVDGDGERNLVSGRSMSPDEYRAFVGFFALDYCGELRSSSSASATGTSQREAETA